MTASAEITPPIAHYLMRIDQAEQDLKEGVFSADGLITPASDSSSGYKVRLWDKIGAKTVMCATASDVNLCLTEARSAAVHKHLVERHVSHAFYQSFFNAVDARRPLHMTNAELRLCGAYRKIAKAIGVYNAFIRDEDQSKHDPESQKVFRALSIAVDRAIKRANNLYAEVEAEAADASGNLVDLVKKI